VVLSRGSFMSTRSFGDFSSIYNYHQWRPDLASAGQPEVEELEALVAKGFNWGINLGLLGTYYALDDEAGLVHALGLHYRHIAVQFEAPTLDDFQRFCDIMNASEGGKRFVHCAANYRASVFIALYLHLYQNADYESVMNQVYQIWQPDKVWRPFISSVLEQHAQTVEEV